MVKTNNGWFRVVPQFEWLISQVSQKHFGPKKVKYLYRSTHRSLRGTRGSAVLNRAILVIRTRLRPEHTLHHSSIPLNAPLLNSIVPNRPLLVRRQQWWKHFDFSCRPASVLGPRFRDTAVDTEKMVGTNGLGFPPSIQAACPQFKLHGEIHVCFRCHSWSIY